MNMKRVILFAFALLTIGSAFAQTVSVNDVYVRPGETAQFAVSVTFPEGKADTYTAMTLYVQFPATGFTTTGAYTVSSSWVGASTTVGDVDNTGHATIPFASSNAIPGSSVDNLVSVSFTVDSNVEYGDYDVTLSKTMFEYNTSDKDYAPDVTFNVHVVDYVVLDELSEEVPEQENNVKVKVKRTINANEWSTICLPFAMSEYQIRSAFGENVTVELADFTGCVANQDADDNIIGLSLGFGIVTETEANHPYLIRVSSPISYDDGFTVNNVNINPSSDNPSVNRDEVKFKSIFFYNRFVGTYKKTVVPKNSLFLSGNKFYYSAGNTKMKAFRGYFDFYDILTEVENAASRISLSFDDSETAGIKTVDKKNSDKYYNLRGQQVETPAKGVYVKDGKKVIIK